VDRPGPRGAGRDGGLNGKARAPCRPIYGAAEGRGNFFGRPGVSTCMNTPASPRMDAPAAESARPSANAPAPVLVPFGCVAPGLEFDLRLFHDGDEALFAEVDRRLRPSLEAVTRRWARDADDADDLAQLTMIRVWEKWTAFSGRGSLLAWTCGVCTNVCREQVRQSGGSSPKRLMCLGRIYHVHRLARWSGTPASVVAAALGFRDPSNYRRLVRTVLGLPSSAVVGRGGPDYVASALVEAVASRPRSVRPSAAADFDTPEADRLASILTRRCALLAAAAHTEPPTKGTHDDRPYLEAPRTYRVAAHHSRRSHGRVLRPPVHGRPFRGAGCRRG